MSQLSMSQLSMSKLITILLAFCAVIGSAVSAAAQSSDVVIDITQRPYLKTDVLVMPLDILSGGQTAARGGDLIGAVILGDLDLSGLIRTGISTDTPDSFQFEYLIEGRVEGPLLDEATSGEEAPLTVSLELMTYPDRQILLSKRYRPLAGQQRVTAHHFANLVLDMVAGGKGICMTRVVFSRGAGDRRDLYVVDYDGEGLLRVTANRTLNLCPSWSPDNSEITFTSYHGGQQGLYSLDTGTGKVRKILALGGLNYGADWRSDGKELLVSLSQGGDPEIYRVGTDGSIIKRLTVWPSIEISPSWAPGGGELVVTSDRTGTPQLSIIDKDGCGRRRLTFEGQYNDSGTWSPRGDQLAYATRIENLTRLVLIKPTGEDRRIVTGPRWGNCEDPSWAPDGRHLVFTSDRSGVFKLYVYDVVEESFRQLTFGDDPDITPAWSN